MPHQSEVPAPPAGAAPRPRIGPLRLLFIFSQVTMIGFGGVVPFAYRELVERRRLIGNEEFAQMFAFGQIMPGPAIANLTFILGYRDSGIPGAVAAVTGLVGLPFLLMLLVGMFYGQYADLQAVRNALTGMGAVTGGLIVATALKMSRGMHRRHRSLLLLLAGFVSFGLLRLPFLAVIGVLAPLAVWLAWREAK
jgi:chromate transporter